MKSILDKAIDRLVISIVVSTIAGIYVNYAFSRISNQSKGNVILGISLGIGVLITTYLALNTVSYIKRVSRKKINLQESDILLKWVEENVEKEDVKSVIREFSRYMEQFFDTHADDTLFDMKCKWLAYKEGRETLTVFINHLHSFLLDKNLNSGEVSASKERLEKIRDEFFSNMRKLKILKMDSKNIYVDLNDKKLKRDIQEYEPYLGYWDKSDAWINDKMWTYVNKMRKSNPSLDFLDIGTGTGRIIKVLCEEKDRVCLIDYDGERLSEAREKVLKILKDETRIKCIKTHFEKLEDPEERSKAGLTNHYDVIICSHVIQHNSTENLSDFYKIIYNLLTPGGVLFLLFPISKSDLDEFVVHGLEFDIIKINRGDFLKSQQNGSMGSLNRYLRAEDGFDTFNTSLTSYNDNSGYWKVTGKASTEPLYEIAERKDKVSAYKRIVDRGLICSIGTEYAAYFSGKDSAGHAIRAINDCLKKYTVYPGQIPENATVLGNMISEYWLISDTKTNNTLMLFDKHGHYVAAPVKRVLKKHRVYNDLLASGCVPPEFLSFIPGGGGTLVLKENEKISFWEIRNRSGEITASIHKTESYYCLILESEERYEFDVDREELLRRQVPSALKKSFFKGTKENPSDFIIDPQVSDGWLIKADDEICYFARHDSDWIRVFRTEPLFGPLVEGDLSIEAHGKFPFKLWNEENITVRPLMKNKMWRLEMKQGKKEKFAELPAYTVVRIMEGKDAKYFAYRDKRYQDLSNLTFNNLCQQQINGLRILPTHRFILRKLKKDLKKENLLVKKHILYHSFRPRQIFIDRLDLRDKYFNLGILKGLRKIHEKLDIQDCMFIVKKETGKV